MKTSNGVKLKNNYYIMRHGQAVSNVKQLVSCWPEKFKNPLTKEGRAMVEKSAQKLIDKKIDLIFASPLTRTRMTSEIVGKVLKIKPTLNKELREQDAGVFNGLDFAKLMDFFGEKDLHRFSLRPKKGETYIEIQKRMLDFLKGIDKKYEDKNILIVSHELPLILLGVAVKGIPNKNFYSHREKISTAEVRRLNPL